MSLKIALISVKGGSGKSTTASALAAAFARMGKSVALLDLDSQGTLIKWGQARQGRGGDLPEITVEKIAAADAEKAFDALERAGADVIIADTSPRATSSQMGLARIADIILVPCQPSMPDIDGVHQTHEILRHIKGALEKSRLVITRAATDISAKNETWMVADHVKQLYKIDMIATITNRKIWQRAMAFGVDVAEVDSTSKAAKELDYLVRMIMKGHK